MDLYNVVCPNCMTTNRVPGNRLGDSPNCGRCKQALFNAEPLAVDATQFGAMISNNDLPVVVDYWAEWCGPCKMFAPAYRQAAEKLEPRMRLLKLDTEANQQVAQQYRIQSIPTLMVFKNGREVARQSGAMPLGSFLQWVEQFAA
jgi:thioredoxin 2